MAQVILKNVSKKYGQVEAVKNLNLEIKDKEFVCLLGPSGCGKSSTLRMIAGLEEINEGEILIDNICVNSIPSPKRNIAMVFETYALYPTKTVYDNMAYPLYIRKIKKYMIEEKVKKASSILELDDVLHKYPKQLSGGQQQRVAIGRAIVRNPKVFLMDEPISHLDAKMKAHMRSELKHLQKELNETFIYVTHDQIEAMAMADRIAIMNKGVLQQYDTPKKIFNFPSNTFVAGFIGDPPMNFIPCIISVDKGEWHIRHEMFDIKMNGKMGKNISNKITNFSKTKEVLLGIRPEHIKLMGEKSSSENFSVKILGVEPLGAKTILNVSVGKHIIKIKMDSPVKVKVGENIFINILSEKLHLFDKDTQDIII